MTPGEAIGYLLVLAGAVLFGPELVTARPNITTVCAGVALSIFGALLICDFHEPEDEHGNHRS